MKQLILIIMFAGLILAACSKDQINEQQLIETTDVFNDIRLVNFSDGTKSTGITMLEFSSIEHFENTIIALEALVEEHEDNFLTAWRSLDDDALNAKEEEIGFVDYQPLIDFENAYNIPSSMRQAFEQAESEWLDNKVLDLSTNPSRVYPFDMAEMTLLNADGEVKIGDFFLILTNEGFIKIDNVDVSTLIRIKEGDLTAYLEPTVTTNIDFDGDLKSGDDCARWKGKDYPHEYVPGSRKVIKHVHFHSYPWKGVSKARITSYIKSGNKWKKYRMNLGVANQSYFRDKYCMQSVSMWSGWKYKKKKSIKEGNSSWGAFPQYRAENGESVYGYFNYAGNSPTRVLTW